MTCICGAKMGGQENDAMLIYYMMRNRKIRAQILTKCNLPGRKKNMLFKGGKRRNYKPYIEQGAQ